MNLLVEGTRGPLAGEVQVPNSKYHAHRALICRSHWTSQVARLLRLARHIRYTVDVLRALGTKIEVDGETTLVTGEAVPREAEDRFVEQFRIDALLHDRFGIACRCRGHALRRSAPARSVRCSRRSRKWACASNRRTVAAGGRAEARPRGGKILIAEPLSQFPVYPLLLVASEPTVIDVEGEFNRRPYVARRPAR